MTYKPNPFGCFIAFSLLPFLVSSQEINYQSLESKFKLEIGYMFPSYQIDQQQFHFGTNIPYTVTEETSAKSTLSLGLLYTKEITSSLKLLLGIMNYYGDYQITFNYFERGSNEAERKFVHDIKTFVPLSPLIAINLSSKEFKTLNYFSFSVGIGWKPIVRIDDKRTHIVEQNNFEREEDSIVEDSALIYPFVKASYDLKSIAFVLSYNHRLYNFIYKQDNTHFNEGEIFNAEISSLSLSLALKF